MEYATDLEGHRFPAIAKATLEMSYDNGGVNRHRSEADVLEALDRILSDGSGFDLPAINQWLATLDSDQLQVAVAGENSEMEHLLAAAPSDTEAFLNAVFERAA